MALVMLVGVFSPLTVLAEPTRPTDPVIPPTGVLDPKDLSATKPTETEIDIYKLTTQQNYKAGAPWEHTGGKIANIGDLGTEVKPLEGAKFTFYKINGTDDVENEKILALLEKNKAKFTTKEDMEKLLAGGAGVTGLTASEKDASLTQITAGKLALATGTGLTNGETAATTAAGLATVKLGDGYYWVIESQIPAKVTGQIAVPFGLTLPLMNVKDVTKADGTIAKAGTHYLTKLYIYPKNIQTDDVQIDKDHANYDNKTGKWYDKDGNEVKSEDLGIKYQDYQREKKTVSRELGQDSPFQSETTIPRNYTFKSFSWVDTMSEGLTYNKDLVVTIDYVDADGTTKKDQPFISSTNKSTFVTERDNGFDIKVTKDQVKDTLVEYLKNGPVTFHFKYSAKVNNAAVVDKPQLNSITFIPQEPIGVPDVSDDNGEIKITKSWKKDGKDVTTPTVTELIYYVEDADTGKTVATVTVKSTDTAGTIIKAVNGITFTVGDNFGSGTFKGLPEGSYKIREAVNGYLPTYEKPGVAPGSDAQAPAGKLDIINEDKPEVKKPSEPKVEFHGKKFVKTDQLKNTDRLFGAEFVIKNNSDDTNNPNKGKFLVVKSDATKISEVTEVKNAKKALDDKIAEYNALTGEQQKAKKADYDSAIDGLQKTYNDAVIKARTTFTWEEGTGTNKDVPPADAYKLVSDGQGRFEITGLSAGKYQLVEITAPVGYAKLEEPVPFEVKEGTYAGDSTTELQYNKADKDGGYGQEVKNKKFTIPQTGGIGTVLFTVVGVGLMAGAVMAMKKNREEA